MTGSKEKVLEVLQAKYKFLPVGTLRDCVKSGENIMDQSLILREIFYETTGA